MGGVGVGGTPIVFGLLALLLPCLLLTHVGSSYPAFFIFGDSLTDAGNNDNLRTIAKANRPPYGRDFPGHQPTGRFCDGPLSTDYIASLAGLPFPPASMSAGSNILHGVAFSSAGAGILNSTGGLLGQHLSFTQQVANFAALKQSLISMIGAEEASSLISKSLFYISIGSNDYIANYFLVVPSGKTTLQRQYSPPAFVDLLQSNLESQILELYSLGARKIALVSLSVVGCVPIELLVRRSRGGKCIAMINDQARAYNTALMSLMEKLQGTYAEARFVYLNAYDVLNNAVTDPSAYGFKYSSTACCGAGPYNAIPCYLRFTTVCQNASEYVFWDLAHPTSAFNTIVANLFWSGSVPSVYPFNLQQLAAL